MAKQIDMFSDFVFTPVFEGAHDYDEAAKRAGIDKLLPIGPCRNCPLNSFCGDECGRLGFSVSVNDPEKYGYHYRY